ncbi:MAG TPA: 5'-3' exonuclease [Solirubrobacteraceae bacterium]|nr:5'-3' exonuclease [Solirubrobacteraceae bacterium]
MSQPLLIADVPWLLYRAFFGLPRSITDEQGRPVNALLGTVNALLSAIAARPPRALVACFGAEQAGYRVELYPAYHAHRDPMPPELATQFERAPELLESFGWTVATSESLEADDLIFSFARREAELGGSALLLTGDRDLFQALDERVGVLQLQGSREPLELGPAEVRERYGIGPALVPDFIALRGDPSDGLPGAPGIGAKTAAELLRRHGSLEGVLADAARPESRERPRTRAVLNEHAELLRIFLEIATLVRVEVEPPSDHAGDFQAGARAAEALGMRGLAERLRRMAL